MIKKRISPGRTLMNKPELPQQPAGHGPPGSNSNTWIIVVILAVVLAVPAFCFCGGVATVVLWSSGPEEATWSADEPRMPSPDRPTRDTLSDSPAKPKPPSPVAHELPPVIVQPDSVVDEPGNETGVSTMQKGALFTLEPFTRDKARMPRNTRVFLVPNAEDESADYVVTLLQFFPDRDPRLHPEDKLIAFATGFTIDAKVPWPQTGAVSFRFLGVGAPETTISISVNEKPVWSYQGGPQESVASPPVVLAGEPPETKTFDLSLTVGGGAENPTGGIQVFSVIASEKGAPEQTDGPPVPAAEKEAAGEANG
jgi:hypothetical protein